MPRAARLLPPGCVLQCSLTLLCARVAPPRQPRATRSRGCVRRATRRCRCARSTKCILLCARETDGGQSVVRDMLLSHDLSCVVLDVPRIGRLVKTQNESVGTAWRAETRMLFVGGGTRRRADARRPRPDASARRAAPRPGPAPGTRRETMRAAARSRSVATERDRKVHCRDAMRACG